MIIYKCTNYKREIQFKMLRVSLQICKFKDKFSGIQVLPHCGSNGGSVSHSDVYSGFGSGTSSRRRSASRSCLNLKE